jgi:hypothetical protein
MELMTASSPILGISFSLICWIQVPKDGDAARDYEEQQLSALV